MYHYLYLYGVTVEIDIAYQAQLTSSVNYATHFSISTLDVRIQIHEELVKENSKFCL